MGWEPGRLCPWAKANPIEAGGFAGCIWGDCTMHDGGTKCARKKGRANRRKAEQSAYRKFPGNDVQQARSARIEAARDAVGPDASFEERMAAGDAFRLPKGRCQWCDGEILKPGGAELNTRRGWHDGRGDEPNCLGDYYRHTRGPDQLQAIISRDGTRCACCGEEKGSWLPGRIWTPEQVIRWGGEWVRRYPAETYVAEWLPVHRQAALEVDHILALALVVLQIAPADRWRYWGPMNLQGLCSRCHSDKTARDVRLIKAARNLDAIEEAI